MAPSLRRFVVSLWESCLRLNGSEHCQKSQIQKPSELAHNRGTSFCSRPGFVQAFCIVGLPPSGKPY
jgi:hypothetical protein